MARYSFASMRLLMAMVSASGVLFGLLLERAEIVVAGAILHLSLGIVDLLYLYGDAKRLRAGTETPVAVRKKSFRIAEWVEGTMAFVGLFLMVWHADERNGYFAAGCMVWGGAVACYFVSGVIIKDVGGVPLSMGFGGWAVRRDRKGRVRH